MTPSYTLVYSKRRPSNKYIMKAISTTGFKTRAHRLAQAMGKSVYYSHALGGYVLSERQAVRFVKLYEEGWDANSFTGELLESSTTGVKP